MTGADDDFGVLCFLVMLMAAVLLYLELALKTNLPWLSLASLMFGWVGG